MTAVLSQLLLLLFGLVPIRVSLHALLRLSVRMARPFLCSLACCSSCPFERGQGISPVPCLSHDNASHISALELDERAVAMHASPIRLFNCPLPALAALAA